MNSTEFIIKLKDGGVEDIYSYDSYIPGCPTCDCSAEYITELNLTLKTMKIFVKVTDSGEYVLSAANTIKLFAKDFSNMTEIEFSEYLKKAIQDISYDEIKFKITDKKGEAINIERQHCK